MKSKHVSSISFLVCVILLVTGSAFAVPANKTVWTFTQPDGTTFQATLHGDEFYSYYQTLSGEIVLKNRDTGEWSYAEPRADGSLRETAVRVGQNGIGIGTLNTQKPQWLKAVQRIAGQRAAEVRSASSPVKAASSKGTVKAVVLLANFYDTSTTYTRSTFNDLLNATGYNLNGAMGSVKDYYFEASYGQLTLQTDVYDWVRLPQTHGYYGQDDSNPNGRQDLNVSQMIEDAIRAADPFVNFADYDSDHDGEVDLFGVVHQGRGQEQGDDLSDSIHSRTGWFQNPIQVDGVRIRAYFTVPELYKSQLMTVSQLTTIGAFCHEIGHVFGLPDLYDGDYSSEGVGDWSIMGSGAWLGPNRNGAKPCHFDPWCKYALGWITRQVMSVAQNAVALPGLDTHPNALLIPVDPYQDGEYFLVANRYARATQSPATGFDRYLPGSGALILHVDEDMADNSNEGRKKVDVEEADGLASLDMKWENNGYNSGDSRDLYPNGGYVFSDSSNPNSRANDGASTGITVSNFLGAGTDAMKCDVTPQAVLKGYTIRYDATSGQMAWLGCGDGDDYACVRFTTDQGGILERVKTYFVYDGTTDYTIKVYSGWVNNKPTGLRTNQSGSHVGTGYQEIALSSPQTFDAGAEFVIEIRYNTSGGCQTPLPMVDDGDCSGRTYASCDGVTYTQFTESNDYPYDALIRAGLRPLSSLVVLTINGSAVTGSISPAGDVDWYQFTVLSAGGYTIQTWGGTLRDTYMSLYGPNSQDTLVIVGAPGASKIIQWLSPGIYYVKIRAYDTAGGTGTYTIAVAVSEEHTFLLGPKELSVDGGSEMGKISPAGDNDWYSFWASSAREYTIQTWGVTLHDTHMTLYGPNDGSTFVTEDDNGGDNGASKIIQWLSPGIYYVKIRAHDTAGGTGIYTIHVAAEPPEGEAGTVLLPARDLLTVNDPAVMGKVLRAGDRNVYAFTVSSTGVYTIQTWAGTLHDTYMRLYGPDSEAIFVTDDDDGGEDGASKIVRTLSAGTYYVDVFGVCDWGTYYIRVSQ